MKPLKIGIFAAILLCFSPCHFQAIKHDPIKAALDTITLSGTFVDEIDFTEDGQIETAAYTIKTVRNQTYVELA